jgi:2-keto-4-pentenoate hydratase/2-oxohepta-3-ene-1,7-dioic acid hydratase in catechol pathway
MRLATYRHPRAAGPRVGALLPETELLVDLASVAALCGEAVPSFATMLDFLDAGPAAREAAERMCDFAASQRPPQALYPLNEVTWQAPVPRPRSIRDCMAFEQHVIQSMRTVVKWRSRPLAALDRGLARLLGRGFLRPPRIWYERPIYYKGNPASAIGHDADVLWPPFTEKLDFELEFGVFIGRRGRDIPVAEARRHIAGYTIFNDFSARDVQLREMAGRLGPAKSKDFDTGNALGPFLVTADEVPDPYDLEMRARVNGAEWSSGNSGDMRFAFEDMIAAISTSETLYPGDFIGSGTLPGGCGLELDRWIAPGDVIELEVSGLGVLRNRVVRPDLRATMTGG